MVPFLSVRRTVAPDIGAFKVSTTLRSSVKARSIAPMPVPLNLMPGTSGEGVSDVPKVEFTSVVVAL